MPERFVVIMAGGRGERFWPQSRLATPKHLLSIVGDQPMLTQTVDRVTGVVPRDNIFVLTTQAQWEGCRRACPNLPSANIVAMLPADHVIHNVVEYQKLLKVAFDSAEAADLLVTIGVKPLGPDTGFGYIQQGSLWRELSGHRVMAVKRFVEKPDLATAKGYLATGEYFWNAGMFVWRVPVVEAAFKAHAAELYAGLAQLEAAAKSTGGWAAALTAVYPTLKKISVD